MRRRWRLVAFAVVGVLAFAAALWIARPRPSKEAVAPPTSTRWPTASPEAESYDFAGDLNLLLTKPDGAVLDSTRPHGDVSLEQAATWFAHPADGALTLRRNEYLREATGTWQLPDGEVVEVRLEQLAVSLARQQYGVLPPVQ